uniref:Uncharacterized protein n=1 Tax=Parascaris univalens TaxID=6257 RepID=A0A915AX43_PARUN
SNSFDDPNFICTPKRLFTFFAITRTLDLIGNAFGFLITTATFTSQTNLSFEALCGREFCFSTHRDDLISSLSSIANFFMIFTRKFIPISTQFIFHALLCIGIFIATLPRRSIYTTIVDASVDQSPIDILAVSETSSISYHLFLCRSFN